MAAQQKRADAKRFAQLVWIDLAGVWYFHGHIYSRGGLSPVPFILILVGFATFMSGVLLRFRPLIFGAAVIWAGALWCLFLSPPQHLLLQAATAVLGYLIPGYLLNAQSRRHVQRT